MVSVGEGSLSLTHFLPLCLSLFLSFLSLPPSLTPSSPLSSSCQNSILNFKINTDPDGKVFITPKKKFSNIQELLEGHKTTPLRSKARPGAKVYLLSPITVEAVQQLLLPPPWQQFFDENYKRHYYYNMQTGQSSWERPKAAPGPPAQPAAPARPGSGNKSMTMGARLSNRPLPSVPQAETGPPTSPRKSLDAGRPSKGVVGSPNVPRANEQHPGMQRDKTRSQSEDFPNMPPLPSKGVSPAVGRRDQPALPPKGHTPSLPPKNDFPPLPVKNETVLPVPHSAPPLPLKNNEFPPLPSKNDSSPPLPSKAPPLPMKDHTPSSLPPLPSKSDPSLPQLPDKEVKATPPPPPPLPDKDPLPSLPPKEDNGFIQGKKKPVEYMDAVITQTPPSPPPPGGGGAPPPPPLPPIGELLGKNICFIFRLELLYSALILRS